LTGYAFAKFSLVTAPKR